MENYSKKGFYNFSFIKKRINNKKKNKQEFDPGSE